MHTTPHALRLKQLIKYYDYEEFRSRRHKLAWPVHTTPDVAVVENIASQVTKEKFEKKNVSMINKCIQDVLKTPDRGLIQHRLNQKKL